MPKVDFSKRTITVQGTEVVFDTQTHFPVLPDLSAEMGGIASAMAWWASVWAAASAEQIDADSFYRHWRAKKAEEFRGADPKLSDEKLKAKIEAHPEFPKMKKALALAEENVVLAKGCFVSLEKKGNMLQSLGANIRSELSKTGLSTPSEPKSAPRRSVREEAEDETEQPWAEPDPSKVAAGEEKMKNTFKGKGGAARFKE